MEHLMNHSNSKRRKIVYIFALIFAGFAVTLALFKNAIGANAIGDGTVTFQGVSDGGEMCIKPLGDNVYWYDPAGRLVNCGVKHPRYFSMTDAPSAVSVTFRRYAGGTCEWNSPIDFTFTLKTRGHYSTNPAAPFNIDTLLKNAEKGGIPDANLQFTEVKQNTKYSYITDITCIYINMGN